MLAKSLALLALTFAVGPKLPLNPTKLPKGLPPGTKAPEMITDLHTSIPDPPAGLKVILLTRYDFTWTFDRDTFRYPDGQTDHETTGVARLHLPVGSTVEWLDCRMNYDADRSPELHRPTMRADVSRFDYGRPMRDTKFEVDFGGVNMRMLRKTGMYWQGNHFPANSAAERHVGINDSFELQLVYTYGGQDRIDFFGCRVGYRP